MDQMRDHNVQAENAISQSFYARAMDAVFHILGFVTER